jgi:XTP/dITP diphosphohydrolase
VTALAYSDGKQVYQSVVGLPGTLERQTGGRPFQWDTIFVPEKSTQTFAQMSVEQKNRSSQRARAMKELVEELRRERVL